MRTTRRIGVGSLRFGALAGTLACAATLAAAGDHEFTKLADKGDIPSLGDRQSTAFEKPSYMSLQGVVVFNELDRRGRNTVAYVADGLGVRTLAEPRDFRGAQTVRVSSINDAGVASLTVGYTGVPDLNSNGDRNIPPFAIFRIGPDGTATQVVRVSGQDVGQGRPFGDVPITDGGGVAWFQGVVDDITQQVLDNGRIVRDDAQSVFEDALTYETFAGIDLNSAGQVAFVGLRRDNGSDVLLSDGGTPANVQVLAGTGPTFRFVNAVSLSDSGLVAFSASEGVGMAGIWTSSGGMPTQVISQETSGFEGVGTPSINDLDEIAFLAVSPGDGASPGQLQWSLYTGPDAANDRVIGTGDTLDGRTVDRVTISNRALNDRGQIAFAVRFTDGEGAFYRADPVGLLVPDGSVPAAFSPSSVRIRNGQLTATGTIQTGGRPFRIGGTPSVRIGGAQISLVVVPPAKGKESLLLTGTDVELTLTPDPAGSSKVAFRLQVAGDVVTGLDADGELALGLDTETATAEGAVALAGGAYKAKKTPASGPSAYPVKVKAKKKGPGKDTFVATFAIPDLGDQPQTAPGVEVLVGNTLALDFPSGAFTGRKTGFQAKSGQQKVVLDYAKKTVSVSFKKVDLGAAPTVGQTLIVELRIDGESFVVPFRVGVKGATWKY